MQTSQHQADRSKRTPRQLPNPEDTKAELLKIPQAAARAGMSVPTVYRKAATDPEFPRLIKIGSRFTRIRRADLDAWIQSLADRAGT